MLGIRQVWIVKHGGSQEGGQMNIELLSTVAVIAPDPSMREPRALRRRARAAARRRRQRLSAQRTSRRVQVLRHLALVPGCRGLLWNSGVAGRGPVPQVSIEFDVGDATAVGSAVRELEQAGLRTAASTAQGTVGADGGQVPVAGGRDRRRLVHP